MSRIETKITKHVNDVLQKYANGLFRNATLDFYGVKTAPIKELINPELPNVAVSGGATDIVFLLEDERYLHLAFNTGHGGIGVMVQSAGYDLRLFERDGRDIQTVIIYTSEVKTKPKGLNLSTLGYNPDVILMNDYEGERIFAALEAKINADQDLTDLDMLNLVLLPLMKHTMTRNELAVKTVEMAKMIPDTTKRNACVAAAVAFASTFLNAADMKNLLEVLKMVDVGAMIVKDAFETKAVEIAKKALKRDSAIEYVMDITGLDEATVRALRVEVDKEMLGVTASA